MPCDFLLMNKSEPVEEFAKMLGFSRLVFQEDFAKSGMVFSKDYETDRKLVETNRIKILVNMHANTFKDTMYFRNGGIDHILCKAANKNKIAFGFSLDSLNNPVMIGRF